MRYFKFLKMCVGLYCICRCICVCVCCICRCPWRPAKDWSWSYRKCKLPDYQMKVLGAELESSGRTANAINRSAASPVPTKLSCLPKSSCLISTILSNHSKIFYEMFLGKGSPSCFTLVFFFNNIQWLRIWNIKTIIYSKNESFVFLNACSLSSQAFLKSVDI